MNDSGDQQFLSLDNPDMELGIEGSPEGIEAAAAQVFDQSMEPTDHFDGGFGDQDEEVKSENQSIRFDQDARFAQMPPLDPNRKVRREVLSIINEHRAIQEQPLTMLDDDIIASQVANCYATFLLEHSENQETLKEFCNELMLGVPVHAIVGLAQLEEDIPKSKPRFLIPTYVDTHGLFLELPDDRAIIEKKEWTHCGIGVANNEDKGVLVELFSQRHLSLSSVQESEDGGVDVRGQMLNNAYGVYAARIVSSEDPKTGLVTIGPANIQYDRGTASFILTLPFQGGFYSSPANYLELYVRKKPETIPYSQGNDEKIKVEDLEFALRVPLELIPDPRIQIENAEDMEKRKKMDEFDEMKRKEELLKKNIEKQARKDRWKRGMGDGSQADFDGAGASSQSNISPRHGGAMSGATPSYDHVESPSPLPSDMKSIESTAKLSSHHGIGDTEGGRSRSDTDQLTDRSGESGGGEFDIGNMSREDAAAHAVMEINQREMREEFVKAIQDALAERDQLKRHNVDLQKSIQGIFERQEIGASTAAQVGERSGDAAMNEHKYLNTLANVHQVRFNLRETQERYNKMATELQEKLNQKQSRCAEITKQFKELKRTVALNSYLSRTGKKIDPGKLVEWEEKDDAKDAELHQCRLRNIALRNRLANREKALKNKEKLADGLHLIDFEQLKIENQTLNEKIEERNEELHKLRKKIVMTVIILTHTREKLQFVQKENEVVSNELSELDNKLTKEREQLANLKRSRDKFRYENQRLRQKIGIVDSEDLNRDHDNLKKNIEREKNLCKRYEKEHIELAMEIKKLQGQLNAMNLDNY